MTLEATSVPAGGTLLERAKAGDEMAFQILAEPFVDIGYRLAFAMLREREAAEDAVQEATLLAWRRLRQLRDEAGLRTWYLTIVANQCRTLRRGRWWGVLRFAEPLPSSPPHDDDADHAGVTDLRRSVERLRHRDRLLLHLYYWLDLPMEEVAAVLGTRPGTARVRLHRLLRRLRLELEPEEIP